MNKRNNPVIDGETISYGPGLSLECHAIIGPEDKRPLNFLDYYDEKDAQQKSLDLSQEATRQIIQLREVDDEVNVLEMSNVERIYSFITEKLEMEPLGKLIFVPGKDEQSSGVTDPGARKAFVFRDTIYDDLSTQPEIVASNSYSSQAADTYNNWRIESVAAHELTHLAGVEDRVYFFVDKETMSQVVDVEMSGFKLEQWRNKRKGAYFEEGLATLVQSMYIWHIIPPDMMDEIVAQPFESPNGVHLDIPSHAIGMGHHAHTFCGWGLERLVKLAPEAWDIMMQSRKYKTDGIVVRRKLKKYLNSVKSGLFDLIDNTDIYNLEEKMETTARIDHLARKSSS